MNIKQAALIVAILMGSLSMTTLKSHYCEEHSHFTYLSEGEELPLYRQMQGGY